jgi:hypothetical protein
LVSTLSVAFEPAIADVLIESSGFFTAAFFTGAAFLIGFTGFAGAFFAAFFATGLVAAFFAGAAFLAGFTAFAGAFFATFFAVGLAIGLADFAGATFFAAFFANFLAMFLRAMRGETLICISSLRQLGARLGGQLEFANDRLPRNSGLDRPPKDGARGSLILGE